MWNDRRSLALSKVCVCTFACALILLDIEGYFVAKVFASLRNMTKTDVMLFSATIYTASVPAWILLYQLWKLLGTVGAGGVFTQGSIRCLRVISWCCVAAALICALSALYYLPFLIAAVAAGFMALIVRIVKNCFEQAVRMKDELDLTV